MGNLKNYCLGAATARRAVNGDVGIVEIGGWGSGNKENCDESQIPSFLSIIRREDNLYIFF